MKDHRILPLEDLGVEDMPSMTVPQWIEHACRYVIYYRTQDQEIQDRGFGIYHQYRRGILTVGEAMQSITRILTNLGLEVKLDASVALVLR